MIPASSSDPKTAFLNLPQVVKEFLFSPDTQTRYGNLLEQHGVSEESDEFDAISDLVGPIDLKVHSLNSLVPSLVRELKWPEDRAKKFAADLAGTRYLPISDFLDKSVWTQIEAWGGDPKKYPVAKIEARPVTVDTLRDEIVRDAHLTLPPRLTDRLRFLLTSRLKSMRDDTQLRAMLTRPEKVGGTELAEADADRIIGILNLKLANAKIVESTEETTDYRLPATADAKATALLPPQSTITIKERPTLDEAMPAAKKFAGPQAPREEIELLSPPKIKKPTNATIFPEDEAEISELKKTMDQKKATLPPPNLGASVENILKTSNLKVPDPELGNRLRSIIEARLRDLRDREETRALVMRPASENGLGMQAKDAETLINLLEAEFLGLQKQFGATKKREELAWQAQQQSPEAMAIKERKKEEHRRDARYLETIKKSKAFKEREVLLPPLPKKSTDYRLPTTEPKKITPVLSPSSIQSPRNEKPRLDDVKFVRKTAGPAEELRTMTIVAFRRLSQYPKERTLKIHDKIELLKGESYENYVAGVRGWQESEPNRLYLEISRAALNTGATVPELLKSRAAANVPTLSLEEFQAILQLNSQLKL